MKLGTRGRLLVGRNVDGKRNAQKSNCLAIGEHGGWNMAMFVIAMFGAGDYISRISYKITRPLSLTGFGSNRQIWRIRASLET